MIQACIPLYTPPPATYADFPPPPFLWNYLLFFFIIFPLVYFLKWSLWKLILKFPPPTPWEGFSGGTSGKESACQCRRHKRCRFNPWVRKIPWRRERLPALVLLPGESRGQRRLVGSSPWGHKESDTTERLSTLFGEKPPVAGEYFRISHWTSMLNPYSHSANTQSHIWMDI